MLLKHLFWSMRVPAARVTAPCVILLRQVVERETLARRAHIPPEGSSICQMSQEIHANVYGWVDDSTPMIYWACYI